MIFLKKSMILVYLKHLTKETEEWMNCPQEAKGGGGTLYLRT